MREPDAVHTWTSWASIDDRLEEEPVLRWIVAPMVTAPFLFPSKRKKKNWIGFFFLVT